MALQTKARREYLRAYRATNSVKLAAYQRQWRRARPARQRAQHLRTAYNITPKEWDVLLAKQRGRCGICGTTKPGGRGCFEVDHNHETGIVRGLLCHQCNGGGGKFKDDPVLLAAAAKWFSQ